MNVTRHSYGHLFVYVCVSFSSFSFAPSICAQHFVDFLCICRTSKSFLVSDFNPFPFLFLRIKFKKISTQSFKICSLSLHKTDRFPFVEKFVILSTSLVLVGHMMNDVEVSMLVSKSLVDNEIDYDRNTVCLSKEDRCLVSIDDFVDEKLIFS